MIAMIRAAETAVDTTIENEGGVVKLEVSNKCCKIGILRHSRTIS